MAPKLPIEPQLPEIVSYVKSNPVTLLQAEPGAGKTTCLPPALMDLGNVIVLEPRRMAAKLPAQFVASKLGTSCGQTVGYQVRHDKLISESTRLRFVTEGLFLRMIQDDPKLSSLDIFVLDEFHERHLAGDIALSYLLQLQRKERPEIKIVVMSATMDQTSLTKYLSMKSFYSIPGKVFPVELKYLPAISKKEGLREHVLRAVQEMLKEKAYSGHILVFLTGVAEIQNCKAELEGKLKEIILKFYRCTPISNPRNRKESLQHQRNGRSFYPPT